MQILLGIIVATIVGVAVHFALPGKQTRGTALAPLVAASVGAVAWTALTWIGLGADNPLLWLSALAVPALVTIPFVLVLTRVRTSGDEAERLRNRIG